MEAVRVWFFGDQSESGWSEVSCSVSKAGRLLLEDTYLRESLTLVDVDLELCHDVRQVPASLFGDTLPASYSVVSLHMMASPRVLSLAFDRQHKAQQFVDCVMEFVELNTKLSVDFHGVLWTLTEGGWRRYYSAVVGAFLVQFDTSRKFERFANEIAVMRNASDGETVARSSLESPQHSLCLRRMTVALQEDVVEESEKKRDLTKTPLSRLLRRNKRRPQCLLRLKKRPSDESCKSCDKTSVVQLGVPTVVEQSDWLLALKRNIDIWTDEDDTASTSSSQHDSSARTQSKLRQRPPTPGALRFGRRKSLPVLQKLQHVPQQAFDETELSPEKLDIVPELREATERSASRSGLKQRARSLFAASPFARNRAPASALQSLGVSASPCVRRAAAVAQAMGGIKTPVFDESDVHVDADLHNMRFFNDDLPSMPLATPGARKKRRRSSRVSAKLRQKLQDLVSNLGASMSRVTDVSDLGELGDIDLLVDTTQTEFEAEETFGVSFAELFDYEVADGSEERVPTRFCGWRHPLAPTRLEHALRCKIMSAQFQRFLDRHLCGENLLFLRDCADFLHIPKAATDFRRRRAAQLVDKFFRADARMQVNVPSKVIKQVQLKAQKMLSDESVLDAMFLPADRAVRELMQMDSLPRFNESSQLRTVLRAVYAHPALARTMWLRRQEIDREILFEKEQEKENRALANEQRQKQTAARRRRVIPLQQTCVPALPDE